jgi:hypothetical protein
MKIHNHQFTIENTAIYIEMIEMNKSVFIHCANEESKDILGCLSVAVPTRFVYLVRLFKDDLSSSSTLLSSQADNPSELIAKRLSKRFQIQVFTSIHIDKHQIHLLEQQLVSYLKSILTCHETLGSNVEHDILLR